MGQLAKNVNFYNNTSWTSLLDMIYPVGAYYISNSSTNPASLFGGAWSAVTGRFLYMNAGNYTGGENTHTLTVNEMPSHRHRIDWRGYWSAAQGSYATVMSHTYVSSDPDYQMFTTYVGGSAAHNNMPAYQTV